MLQACVGCGTPTSGSRCSDCDGRLPGWEWQRLKALILGRDRYICAICGAIATTVDHIVPIAAGGSNAPANLRSLCAICHDERHGRRRDEVDPRHLDARARDRAPTRL
jgi:5-methylcytosine-specific restriction endonuclease McrA